ncbi:Tyrosyl-tRNA synthetase [Pelomyxa schiedti]|nr:Tyrosyl-tRNA synthetase [Pelomyxa schiedti]
MSSSSLLLALRYRDIDARFLREAKQFLASSDNSSCLTLISPSASEPITTATTSSTTSTTGSSCSSAHNATAAASGSKPNRVFEFAFNHEPAQYCACGRRWQWKLDFSREPFQVTPMSAHCQQCSAPITKWCSDVQAFAATHVEITDILDKACSFFLNDYKHAIWEDATTTTAPVSSPEPKGKVPPASTASNQAPDPLVSKCRLCCRQFDAAVIGKTYPPKVTSPNKRIVYGMSCAKPHQGIITFTRWRAMSLQSAYKITHPTLSPSLDFSGTLLNCVDGAFLYEPVDPNSNIVPWHMNFADKQLFGFYGGSLFAQDEMQVAEHPILASLRAALLACPDELCKPITSNASQPTPCAIRGAERRVHIAIEPNTSLGRPNGLYGHQFGQAPANVVTEACTLLSPPTISNILAMEAPKFGKGAYTLSQLNFILQTAYTGYKAAVLESKAYMLEQGKSTTEPFVVMHTGGWGTGAFGGNKVVMTLMQVIAAAFAGVGQIMFHCFDNSGRDAFTEAVSILETVIPPITNSNHQVPVSSLLNAIQALGLLWGQTDGN